MKGSLCAFIASENGASCVVSDWMAISCSCRCFSDPASTRSANSSGEPAMPSASRRSRVPARTRACAVRPSTWISISGVAPTSPSTP